MRVPWSKSKPLQLDLLSSDPAADNDSNLNGGVGGEPVQLVARSISTGEPLIVSTASLFEDPNNPRTEYPTAELEELTEDIRQHGILQPIVVHRSRHADACRQLKQQCRGDQACNWAAVIEDQGNGASTTDMTWVDSGRRIRRLR